MATNEMPPSTLSDVLYQGPRKIRDLGNDQPGFSLERNAARSLDVLDENGVDTDQCVTVAIYADGSIAADLQTDE